MDAMDSFVSAYNEGLNAFDSMVWICREALGGIIVIIFIAIACRLLLRAWLLSCFGPTIARVGGGVIELSLIGLCLIKSFGNPTALVTTMGWCAAFFQALQGGQTPHG